MVTGGWRSAAAVVGVLACASAAFGGGGAGADAGPRLAPGDPAPALAVTEWIKGDAVERFQPGKVYLVELWATWCGPCLKAMPHLTEIQAAHAKDVTVLAVDVFERVNGEARRDKVRATADAMGEKMGVRVGIDGNRVMEKTWYTAAQRRGIPSTFVVDGNGRIAWIGHPNDVEPVLEGVLGGTWNLAAARHAYLEELAQMSVLTPQARARLRARRAKLKRMYEMLNAGDYDGFGKLADEMVGADLRDDAVQLNALAWRIATDRNVDKRDLDLARRASTRACEITGWNDVYALDTYARVLWERGDRAGALRWQRKAAAALKPDADDTLRRQVEGALERYENAATRETDDTTKGGEGRREGSPNPA